jgi:DNA-directed RNA polymerase subunit N (RpoN/RPB10)
MFDEIKRWLCGQIIGHNIPHDAFMALLDRDVGTYVYAHCIHCGRFVGARFENEQDRVAEEYYIEWR